MKIPYEHDVLSDTDLEQDSKTRQHYRVQAVQDHVMRILIVAIYALPAFVAVGYLIIFGVQIYQGDWTGVQSMLDKVVYGVLGAVAVTVLQQFNLLKGDK